MILVYNQIVWKQEKMVWLDPAERHTTPESDSQAWLSIKEEEGFVLQQYQPHMDTEKAFLTDKPFRIILRANHQNLLVAQDGSFPVIIDHWEWLENNIFAQVRLLSDLPEEELFQFAVLKISSLVKCSEIADPLPRNRLASPEQFFNELYPNLTLVEYCKCCLWEQLLFKGIIFLSTKHVFFYSESEQKSLVLPFVEISLVQQNHTGMVPNSLEISTIGGDKFLFSNLHDLQEVYDIVNGLWEFSIFIVLQKIEEDMQELNWELEEEDETFEQPHRVTIPSQYSSYCNRFGFTQETISKEALIEFSKYKNFQKNFHLPNTEKLLAKHSCILEGWAPGYIKDISGNLFVSDNFITFRSSSDETSVVIASMAISNVESRFPDKIIITTKKITFKFSKIPQNSEISLQILRSWDGFWKRNVLMDVSQVRESISKQARVSREKQRFFKDSVEGLSDLQILDWKNYIKSNPLGLVSIRTPKLGELIRSGLPRRYRGEIWQLLSGSLYKEHLFPLEYRNILREGIEQETLATEEIGRDINRTFPEHPFYQKERGRNILKQILTAYSFRNPSIGYCQSMNIVCAFQMLFMPEEKAYWMVSSVCEDILPDYYAPSMIGCTTDQAVFEYLLQHHMPKLHAHFIYLMIPITLITIPWLLCTFIGFLSWKVTLRVLDCFFYEGRQVLFQVGLSIFKIYQSRILDCDDGVDVIELLKNSDVECDELFKVAFGDFGDLDSDSIEKLHKELRSKVVRDLQCKLEKRKQTAALQLSKKRFKAKRSNSTDFPTPTVNSIATLSTPPTTPKLLANHVLKAQTIAGSIGKVAHGKICKGAEAVFRFRSSRRAPIQLSPAFKPEDQENTHSPHHGEGHYNLEKQN